MQRNKRLKNIVTLFSPITVGVLAFSLLYPSIRETYTPKTADNSAIIGEVLLPEENTSYLKESINLPTYEPNAEAIKTSSIKLSIQKDIDHLYNHLLRFGKRIANYEIAKIIVTESRNAGADYRIVMAIIINESGYCRIPYKGFNCFGYLNGVQYSSFEEAFRILTPKVARIVAKHNWNTRALAKTYGAQNVDHWGDKIYKIALSI